jgi:hypothetical protein
MILVVSCLFFPTFAVAGVVVFDGFDNGQLDSAWQIGYREYANGWSYAEAGTNLTVTEVAVTTNRQWGDVSLSRTIASMGDFAASLAFSWDSENNDRAIQRFGIYLKDAAGNNVVCAGYNDAWQLQRGEKTASGGGVSYASGYNSLPLAGSTIINIVRIGNDISVSWNGQKYFTTQSSTAVTQVEISFGHYKYDASNSFFGTIAVDYISVIPEPATLSLLLVGLIGIARRKHK